MRSVLMPIGGCAWLSAISTGLDNARASLGNVAAVLRHTLGVRSNVAGIGTLHPLGTSNSDPWSDVGQWHEAASK